MPGCNDLGTDAAATRVEEVLTSANRFETQAQLVSSDLAAVCGRMAADLGVDVPTASGQTEAEAACGAVRDEIDAIAPTLGAGAQIVVTATPPSCFVDAQATANCVAECDVSYDASGMIECSGGEVRGECSADCTGQCYLEGNITCAAECQGTCTGTCTGTCNGMCDGTCSLMDSTGKCIGECTGECTGRCSADCTGTCMGTCVAEVAGACMGTCEGACSVEFMEPRCTGDVDIMADASCEAACDAELRAEATCTEPTVAVTVVGALSNDARALALVDTLQQNWPDFLAVTARLEGVASAGQAFGQRVVDLSGSVAGVGVQAGACLTLAADGVASAVTNVSASVSVSVEVQASVTATGG